MEISLTTRFEKAFQLVSGGQTHVDTKDIEKLAHSVGLCPVLADLPQSFTDGTRGQITQPEFVNWGTQLWKRQQSHTPQYIAQIFQLYDPQRTGTVKADAFRLVLKNLGDPMADAQIETLHRELAGGGEMINYLDFANRLYDIQPKLTLI